MSMESIDCITSLSNEISQTLDITEEFFQDNIRALQHSSNESLADFLKGSKKITAPTRDYLEKRKSMDRARSLPIPPGFKQVVTFSDSRVTEGYGVHTFNIPSRIFYGLATALYRRQEPIFTTQVKLMFLQQINKDYNGAKEARDVDEIRKFVLLITRSVAGREEAWLDDEWIMASKAFFSPIHVLFRCSRVPNNPHIKRYAFSPVLDEELPIRLVVENMEYIPTVLK